MYSEQHHNLTSNCCINFIFIILFFIVFSILCSVIYVIMWIIMFFFIGCILIFGSLLNVIFILFDRLFGKMYNFTVTLHRLSRNCLLSHRFVFKLLIIKGLKTFYLLHENIWIDFCTIYLLFMQLDSVIVDVFYQANIFLVFSMHGITLYYHFTVFQQQKDQVNLMLNLTKFTRNFLVF
jgi:hypothetical protein